MHWSECITYHIMLYSVNVYVYVGIVVHIGWRGCQVRSGIYAAYGRNHGRGKNEQMWGRITNMQ